MKKRGTGVGKWNGVGGKVGPGETIEMAAIRECQEEIGVTPKKLEKVGLIDFQIPSQDFHNVAHVYFCWDWEGEPTESEEMRPVWYARDSIPYDQMWSDDRLWLPKVLAGEKIAAAFLFDDNELVVEAVFSSLGEGQSKRASLK